MLPHVWTGSVDALDETYAAALARLTAEQGPPAGARATTRMVSVVDRLLLLAAVTRDADGQVALAPPRGGYLLSCARARRRDAAAGRPAPRLMLAGMGALALSDPASRGGGGPLVAGLLAA